jgi:hypothetical protein
LAAKSAEDLWSADLDVFEAAYGQFVAVREEARAQVAVAAAGVKKKVVKKLAKK